MPNRLHEPLDQNRQWAEGVGASKPGFFTNLLAQQAPQYLWIGCADSRVPANEILGLLPGDVFVHRNIANWLRHVQDVRNKHRAFLEARADDESRLQALCELNVLEKALNVCETTVVQDAWARKQSVVVHGWVYGLHNGLLEDLTMTVRTAADVEPAYDRALVALQARFAAARAAPRLPVDLA